MNASPKRFWSGPSLALQIMGLLLGGLVVAQLVTLALTWLLPPEPQPTYGLQDIARVLAVASPDGRGPFQRVIENGPPQPTGPGWLTSERSRHDLAMLLGRDDADVRLFFFTPLPFAGATGVAPREPQPISKRPIAFDDDAAPVRLAYADYQIAQARPGGAPGGPGGPGGAGPGGPGGPGNPTGMSGPGGGGPTAGTPRGAMPPSSAGTNDRRTTNAPPGDGSFNTVRPSDVPGARSAPTMNRGAPTGDLTRGDVPQSAPLLPEAETTGSTPSRSSRTTRDVTEAPRVQRVEPVVVPPASATKKSDVPSSAARAKTPGVSSTRVDERPVAIAPTRGLFGFAPAPFVEGDFVAGLRLVSGGWAVVQPTPEPFPNAWQRRVLLWFAIAALLVAPLGWLFSRRLVRPISGFAAAAERLGRDPTAAILPLDGPAEVGRAAHAFNRMQNRLRSFVDDRTAMIGAISHDLRTPLTRMRFRIEDAPDDVRRGMLHEVEEMEAMITSVLAFIRDASEPGSRERLDLSSIVEDVVEDAVFVGKPVTLETRERAPVEVDAIGMRRLLTNLVENAVKYGERAEVRLFTDRQDVVTEVSDHGPGLDDDELERVFQPFYRTASARASDKSGSGLGLAVCRSIARAHGGDVQLMRGRRGLVAQVRLPLAYGVAA